MCNDNTHHISFQIVKYFKRNFTPNPQRTTVITSSTWTLNPSVSYQDSEKPKHSRKSGEVTPRTHLPYTNRNKRNKNPRNKNKKIKKTKHANDDVARALRYHAQNPQCTWTLIDTILDTSLKTYYLLSDDHSPPPSAEWSYTTTQSQYITPALVTTHNVRTCVQTRWQLRRVMYVQMQCKCANTART